MPLVVNGVILDCSYKSSKRVIVRVAMIIAMRVVTTGRCIVLRLKSNQDTTMLLQGPHNASEMSANFTIGYHLVSDNVRIDLLSDSS